MPATAGRFLRPLLPGCFTVHQWWCLTKLAGISMSVLSKLASSQNRRDEVPNQELARQIVKDNDKKAVRELVENLSNKSKAIQSDCIKTLYEIGEQNPSLIAAHVADFIALLDSKNNRLQWGAMSALNTVAPEKWKE